MALRKLGRIRAFAGLAYATCKIPLWLMTKAGSVHARAHERAFFARVAASFGIKIETHGSIERGPAALYVMNHISWADVPVMMTLLDADFVAKADILRWPLLGPLARRLDPVFVARGERHRSHLQADAVRARLALGRSVILCAEGTTSEGTSVLPFQTSLFAAADAANWIQPILLSYLTPEANALSPRRRREIAWIDDDELLSGAARVARTDTLARAAFLEPIKPNGADRKRLAFEIRNQIVAAQAAAPNRSR
jgi:lyso-ornithine lipid O-acyltransferase